MPLKVPNFINPLKGLTVYKNVLCKLDFFPSSVIMAKHKKVGEIYAFLPSLNG